MKLLNQPFFSVIIPACNCEKYIIDAIQSVEKQTYQDWEIIIIEDHSNDDTYAIISDYIQSKNKIKLLQTSSNSGSPGLPRDIGVTSARGKFIGFLDGDDIYHPEKLQLHFNTINANPSIEIIHTAYNIVSPNKQFIKYRKQPFFQKIYSFLFKTKTACLLTNPFCLSTVIIKKELISQYKFALVPTLFSAVEDWFLWNRIFYDRIPVIYYNKTALLDYRWIETSISGRDIHRCELQAVVFFSFLFRNGQIHIIEWFLATFIRLVRIFFKKFFGYEVI